MMIFKLSLGDKEVEFRTCFHENAIHDIKKFHDVEAANDYVEMLTQELFVELPNKVIELVNMSQSYLKLDEIHFKNHPLRGKLPHPALDGRIKFDE